MSGLFPNAWHVARREYLQRVRSRSFLIVTAVLAVAGLAIGLVPVIGRLIEGDATTSISVYSADAELRSTSATAIGFILAATTDGSDGIADPYRIDPVDDPDAARQQVRRGELDGLLTVKRAEDGDLAWEAFTDASLMDPRLVAVRQAATQVTIGDRLERAGVEPDEAGEIFAPTAFEVTPVDPAASGDEPDFGPDYVLSNALVILTFMAVVTYGSWVATSVAEEKSSRVMELLITAAHPRQLLAGKVLGNGGAGLTQYVVVLTSVLVAVLLQGLIADQLFGSGGGAALDQLDLAVLVPFALLFVPGFMLYCILYAGLGSLASRQEDVTQVTGPMLFLGMGGYFVAFVAMATPDVDWIKVLSLIPFFSPYLLPTRFLLGTPPAAWEWLAAGALMLIFLLVALWIAARIYSAGVLLYGQRLSLRSAWKAVRVNR
jgi:ABC-2 type transport system permease protein